MIITVAFKYPGCHQLGNIHVSWAGEVLISHGWQSPRDGIWIKILVAVQSKNR